MVDYMNEEQYRKALRYRMQETIENLAVLWHVPDEQVDSELINTSCDWLERMLGELHYFNKKIVHASEGPPEPGFVPEQAGKGADLR
ncbi:MAG: hypothetical protein GX060_00525 [Firmicutes bacterium]|nr:hypothetical protein [Bacillota bacterium]